MKTILVDTTYIYNKEALRKSVAIYLLRFLDNLNTELIPDIKIILLVRCELFDFFQNRYKCHDFDVIRFKTLRLINISFLQSMVDALMWKYQINSIKCDSVYVPFTWIYNSLRVNKRKIITIHDLKPIREITTVYAGRVLFLKPVILSVFKFFFNRAIQNSFKIIAISEFVKKDIECTFKIFPRIDVIYYGIPDGNDVAAIPIAALENCDFLLYVNTIDRFKNTITLLKAFKELNTKKYALVIVGKNTDYWRSFCEPIIKPSDNIVRLDYVSDGELLWLYRNASMFITTSLREGLGATPIEAAMAGCPVVSSRSEALPEATMESVFYYAPADSYTALAETINYVFDRKENDVLSFKLSLQKIRDNLQGRYNIINFSKNIINYLCCNEDS